MEMLLPGRTHLFAWDWDALSGDGAGRVWVTATKRELVATAREQGAAAGQPAPRVTPMMPAVAAGLAALCEPLPPRLVVVHVAAASTSLMVLVEGRLHGGAVLDAGAEQWRDDTTACLLELREIYGDQLQSMPRESRPNVAVALGDGVDSHAICAALGVDSWTPPADAPLNCVTAVGAAVMQFGEAHPAINLAEQAKQQGHAATWRVMPRRRTILLALLAAAVMFLYVADVDTARRLEQTVLEARAASEEHGDVAFRLAVGRYLESGGALPLAMCDEITQLATEQTQITAWQITRGESVHLSGIAADPSDLNTLLESLSRAVTLKDVRLEHQKINNNKCEFQIAARVGHGQPKVPVKEPEPQPQPDKKEDPS
jgi:hypothetical protein